MAAMKSKCCSYWDMYLDTLSLQNICHEIGDEFHFMMKIPYL